MRKAVLLILIVCFVFLNLLGCSYQKPKENKGDVIKTEMIKSNTPYSMRVNLSAAIRRSAIEEKYGKAQIIRNLKLINYEIRNMDDGSKLFVIYDNDTNRVVDIWQLKKLFSKGNFTNIIPQKSTLNDVIKIDPYANVVEKSKEIAITEHKLDNNKVCIITYFMKNGIWTVKDLDFIDDPSEFTKILSEDLPSLH
ncbi:MAG: hypothetical protein WCQ54_14270 [Clostridiaceae bacterium]